MTMAEAIELGEMVVDVIRKDVKNINLRVYPPTGRVQISAPFRMSLATVRAFAISKLGWIKRVQKRLRRQAGTVPLKFIDGESHDVWGGHYLLRVVKKAAPPHVHMEHSTLVVGLAPWSRDSGQKRGQRAIRGGRGMVRKALYLCVCSVIQVDGELRSFYQKLRQRGKPGNLALVAVMRKLLLQLNALARRQTPWVVWPA